MIYYADRLIALHHGDCMDVMAGMYDRSVHCSVSSPPYWALRDYKLDSAHWPAVDYSPMPGLPMMTIPEMECCLGLEPSPEAYVGHLVHIYREVRRVLRDDGVCWINIGDSYAQDTKWGGRSFGKNDGSAAGGYREARNRRLKSGLKSKDMACIPWRLGLALQADGWWLRMDVIWEKTNGMVSSVKDRPTKTHEYILQLAKSEIYCYDRVPIMQPLKESSIKRLQRGVSGEHKNVDGAPGQPPHSLNKPRKNVRGQAQGDVPYGDATRPQQQHGNKIWGVRFGGDKAAGYGATTYSGNEWKPTSDMANARSIWTFATKGLKAKHYAAFPEELARRCVSTGAPEGGCCAICGRPWKRSGSGWVSDCACRCSERVPCAVLDHFAGTGTTLKVAADLGRRAIGIEASEEFCAIAVDSRICAPKKEKKKGTARNGKLRERETGKQDRGESKDVPWHTLPLWSGGGPV